MSVIVPERRKIALVDGERRLDLLVPLDDTLGNVLSGLGYIIEPGRHVVLERGGRETKLGILAAELSDGALFAIVDLRANEPLAPTVREQRTTTRYDRGNVWWMLAMIAIVAVGTAVYSNNSDGVVLGTVERAVVSAVLGVAAIVSALAWAFRQSNDNPADALAMLAPLGLAFASGMLAVPSGLEASLQLGIFSGLLAAGILATVLTTSVGGVRLRGASSAVAILLLVFAGVWGITLAMGWGLVAAGAISAGAVPIALRAIPSTLVNVPEGYHIDYARFMSNRWTVRGTIPVSPDQVRFTEVLRIVHDSSARLLAGTVLLSIIAVTMMPIALAGNWRANLLIEIGTIALVVLLVLALLLVPRHTLNPILRWVPRSAAVIVMLEAAVVATAEFGSQSLVIASIVFLVIGIIAAAVLVPIGRGSSSLGWSRLADVMEGLAVAFCLPAALLAADAIDLLRGMMAA